MIRKLGGFEIDIEVFLQFVMDRNFFLLAAFFPKPDDRPLSDLKVILRGQRYDRSDSRESVCHYAEERTIS